MSDHNHAPPIHTPPDPRIVDRPDIRQCDVMGDVHGCYDELAELLLQLGHADLLDPDLPQLPDHPPRLIFVGDIVDRGDRILDCLELVMRLRSRGYADMVIGNHDFKFYRWLLGHDLQVRHGLQESIDEFRSIPESRQRVLRAQYMQFFADLPNAIRIDDRQAVVVHAAWRPDLIGETNRHRIRGYTMYGPTTGAKTPEGFPERLDWAPDYAGPELAVFGHQVYAVPYLQPHAIGIDTGCVFGGALSALRYPSLQILSVPSHRARFTISGQKILDRE